MQQNVNKTNCHWVDEENSSRDEVNKLKINYEGLFNYSLRKLQVLSTKMGLERNFKKDSILYVINYKFNNLLFLKGGLVFNKKKI